MILLRKSSVLCSRFVHLGLFLYLLSDKSCFVNSKKPPSTPTRTEDVTSRTTADGRTFRFDETSTSRISQRMAGSKGKGTTRVRPFSSGTINFPDEEESDLPVRIDLQGKNKNKSGAHSTASSCLNGSTVCEKVDNYPEDDILNEILSKTKGLSLFSTVDLAEDNSITNRIGHGDGNHEEYLCESTEKVMFLQGGVNKDGEFKLIVNNRKVEQGIRVGTCVAKEASCKYGDNFPPNFSTRCVQEYITRQLWAVDNGKAVMDHFRIPSCCVCKVTQHNFEPPERRNNGETLAPDPLAL